MNKKNLAFTIVLLFCLFLFNSCDPIYPTGKLKVEPIGTLSQGESTEVKIIYPNTGGSIVLGWKNEIIEIVTGTEIINVSELNITGLKAGTAKIKVSATTIISKEAAESGSVEKIYSAEIEIKVK